MENLLVKPKPMNIKVLVQRLLYSRADEESLLKKILLLPLSLLSLIYRFLVRSRLGLYNGGILKIHSLPCRVISVGNITLGGTGKTPTVIYLAGLFKEKGMQPVVLSRGYKAKSSAATAVVSNGATTFMDPQEAGDEPFLLVTSAFHIPRAIFFLRKIGLNPIAAPADFLGQSRYNYAFSPWFPAADHFAHSSYAIKEYAGLLFYRFLK